MICWVGKGIGYVLGGRRKATCQIPKIIMTIPKNYHSLCFSREKCVLTVMYTLRFSPNLYVCFDKEMCVFWKRLPPFIFFIHLPDCCCFTSPRNVLIKSSFGWLFAWLSSNRVLPANRRSRNRHFTRNWFPRGVLWEWPNHSLLYPQG